MIKLIAFDLVGVLVSEKDDVLTDQQDKIERFFGENYSDEQFLSDVQNKYGLSKDVIEEEVDYIVNNLYQVKDKHLFKKLKKDFRGNIVIATNHVSKIKSFIETNFIVDDIFISANMHSAKPDKDFYLAIVEKYKLKPSEVLFVDDSLQNIEGALSVGLNALHIERNTDVYDLVTKALNSI